MLTQSWQNDISSRVDEVALAIKLEIASVTDKLNTLCQDLSIAKKYRPNQLPETQDISAAQITSIAAFELFSDTPIPHDTPGIISVVTPRQGRW